MSMSRRIRRRRSASLASAIEPLEGRLLLATTFQVSTNLAGHNESPSTAMGDTGAFVIGWSDPSGMGISNSVRRYSAAAAPQGQTIEWNEDFDSGNTSVAADAAGNFVAAYQVYEPGGHNLLVQRYGSDGTARGTPIRASISTSVAHPRVAMDADGDFVVAWSEFYGQYIVARQFDATGKPKGQPFQVNTSQFTSVSGLSVAMDADGDFLVTWDGINYDNSGSHSGSYARRYNAAGVAQGKPWTLRYGSLAFPGHPTADFDAAGNSYVAWQAGNNIFIQRCNPTGKALGKKISVSALDHSTPVVTAGPAGEWALLWVSAGKSSTKLYLQQYQGAAKKGKGLTLASAPDANFQPSASMSSSGALVAAWMSDSGEETPNVMAWHAPALPSEIKVWQGKGKKAQELQDKQASAQNFGTVKVKAAAPLITFTVMNAGTGTLSLGGVTLPKGFEIVDPLVSSLAPGAWDVFSVRMITQSAAKRSAFIRIASNDANENPFDIWVLGEIKP